MAVDVGAQIFFKILVHVVAHSHHPLVSVRSSANRQHYRTVHLTLHIVGIFHRVKHGTDLEGSCSVPVDIHIFAK